MNVLKSDISSIFLGSSKDLIPPPPNKKKKGKHNTASKTPYKKQNFLYKNFRNIVCTSIKFTKKYR